MSFDIVAATQGDVAKEMEEFDSLVQQDLKWIPNIKLLQDGAKETKEKNHNEFFAPKAGEFILGKKVLGKKFKALICAWRSKAIAFTGDGKPEISYDRNSDKFKEIAGHTDGSFGPEFLCWLPDVAGFGLIHFKGTAKNNAASVLASKGKPSYIYSDEASTSKHEWLTPVGAPGDWEINAENSPTKELFEKVMDLFNNPEREEVEAPKAEKKASKRKR